MTGFRASDREIRGLKPPAEDGAIELGFVDKGELDTPYDAGDVDLNDGNTLVQVKLVRGNQQLLWCRISTSVFNLPEDGEQVMVAIPAGLGYSIGAGVIIATMGPNRQPLPGLKKKEPILMGPARNFVRLDAAGNVSLFTTDDGTQSGKSVFAQVRPDGFRFVHPQGKMVLDKTGFHVLHSSGARIDLGAISGLPAPLDALGSYAKLSAATVQIEGAAVALGTAAGLVDPVAKSTPTLAVFSAVTGALTTIQTALAAVNVLAAVVDPDPVTKASAAAAATAALAIAVTAVAAAGTALGTAATTLPSATTVT